MIAGMDTLLVWLQLCFFFFLSLSFFFFFFLLFFSPPQRSEGSGANVGAVSAVCNQRDVFTVFNTD